MHCVAATWGIQPLILRKIYSHFQLRLREERLAKKKEKEDAERRKAEAERAAREQAAAAEGMKKAALRLSDRKKNEVSLGLSDEDSQNLAVVFKHYCLNRVRRIDFLVSSFFLYESVHARTYPCSLRFLFDCERFLLGALILLLRSRWTCPALIG